MLLKWFKFNKSSETNERSLINISHHGIIGVRKNGTVCEDEKAISNPHLSPYFRLTIIIGSRDDDPAWQVITDFEKYAWLGSGGIIWTTNKIMVPSRIKDVVDYRLGPKERDILYTAVSHDMENNDRFTYEPCDFIKPIGPNDPGEGLWIGATLRDNRGKRTTEWIRRRMYR